VTGQLTRLRQRLEADAKSLCALYEYGRLHGGVRLRWGFLDEQLSVSWADIDEPGLWELMSRGLELDTPLEVVVGTAPGWEEPWARVRRVRAVKDGWRTRLIDEQRHVVDVRDVQRARLVTPV
jgi:hypothetical protein